MFISNDQKERDSATAYRTSALPWDQMVYMRVLLFVRWRSISVLLSGMMVEVLGTVLGTAIQGQIVGGTTNCPAEPDSNNSTTVNMSSVALDETVSLSNLLHCGRSVRIFPTISYSFYMSYCGLFCPQKQAYLVASGVICIIYVLCAAILFFGVKEQKGMNTWNNETFLFVQSHCGIYIMFKAEMKLKQKLKRLGLTPTTRDFTWSLLAWKEIYVVKSSAANQLLLFPGNR